MCELLLDVDVVIKMAAYGLLSAIQHPGCPLDCGGRLGVTSATRFVASKRLKRKAADTAAAQANLEDFLAEAVELEPSESELQLAAHIESEAALAGLELDAGESQLCAIAIVRVVPALLTGDKRAISAAERLLATVTELGALVARIACLEQAVTLAVERIGALTVRERVLAEPAIDTAISISFQFTNPVFDANFEPTGLRSYIEDLRRSAPALLLAGDRLKLPSVA